MKELYEGDGNFIFISYAHRDASLVMPIITTLRECNFRVWYDGGIQAGTEWPEYIASRLQKSALCIAFITENYMASFNCKRELIFAVNQGKSLLTVYLDDTAIPSSIKMPCYANVCDRLEFRSEKKFRHKITECARKYDCAFTEDELTSLPDVEDETSDSSVAESKKYINELHSRKEQRKKNKASRKRTAFAIAYLIQLSYFFIGPMVMNAATANSSNGWVLILQTLIPYLVLQIICQRVLRFAETYYSMDNDTLGVMLVATIIFFASTIASMFYVNTTDSFFLSALISLGLNILSGIVTFIVVKIMDS